jgi:hypothetical protein
LRIILKCKMKLVVFGLLAVALLVRLLLAAIHYGLRIWRLIPFLRAAPCQRVQRKRPQRRIGSAHRQHRTKHHAPPRLSLPLRRLVKKCGHKSDVRLLVLSGGIAVLT